MPFRFRRTIGLGKGLRLNLGKTRSSLSLGGKGFTVNLGKHGTRTTVGIPGTGLSYSETSGNKDQINNVADTSSSWSTILDLLSNGCGLVVSIVSFLVSCLVAIVVIYLAIVFLFS